jgi:pimeloyl-ACP methyl ester carboxylesterase
MLSNNGNILPVRKHLLWLLAGSTAMDQIKDLFPATLRETMNANDRSSIQEQLILRDGRVLSYAVYGSRTGLPVIGFHGMPGSRIMMQVLEPAARSAGIRLIAPERPGYGRSSPQPRAGLIEYQQDVRQLVEALDCDRFGVLGVSGGGPYALACAHEMPGRLAAAVVVSGIGLLRQPQSLKGMQSTNRIMLGLGRLSPALTGFLLPRLITKSLPSLDKQVRLGASPSPEIPPGIFATVVADQRESIRAGGRGVVYDMTALWRPWGFNLEDIRSRVYLLHGADDNLALPHLTRQLASRLADCEVVFYPGEGHEGPLTKHHGDIMNAFQTA